MAQCILQYLLIAVVLIHFNRANQLKIQFQEELKPGEKLLINKTVIEYVNSEGSEPRSQPTVTTESMKSELYVGQNIDPNPIIFVKKVEPVRVVEMRIDDYETTVYIKHQSLPIVVGGRIFFWGSENLPNANTTDCIELSSANQKGNVSICDTESKLRCVRDPSALLNRGQHPNWKYANEWPEDRILKILLPGEKILSELAWLCPVNSRCCEWECCVDKYMIGAVSAPKQIDLGRTIFIVAVISIAAMLIIMAPFFRCAYTGRMMSRTAPIERLNERGELELLQRTSAYPKQERESWSRYVSVSIGTRSSKTTFVKQNEANATIEQQKKQSPA